MIFEGRTANPNSRVDGNWRTSELPGKRALTDRLEASDVDVQTPGARLQPRSPASFAPIQAKTHASVEALFGGHVIQRRQGAAAQAKDGEGVPASAFGADFSADDIGGRAAQGGSAMLSAGERQDGAGRAAPIQRKCAACGSPADVSGACTSCGSTSRPSTGSAETRTTSSTPRARRAREGGAAGGQTDGELIDRSCITANVGEGPTRRPFTSREVATLTAVKAAAASLTSQSLLAVTSGDRYMATVSQRVFGVVVPVQRLQSTITAILGRLRGTPLVSATCADEDCNRAGVVAYTSDDLSTIAICPRFFLLAAPEMRRTLIHEAGHAAGIDSSSPGNEQYCSESADACDHPCGGVSGDVTQNVDAWARFIECSAFSR